MTVDSQPRATGPRQGDEPTRAPLRDGPTDEAPPVHDCAPDGTLDQGESSGQDVAPGEDHGHREDEEPAKAASDRPSGVQVAASALAAVTATAMLSTLGVAGTLIGAALSSIVTVFANYLYTSSLRRTADKVAAAPPVQKVRARTRVGTTAVLRVPADGAATGGRQTATLAVATAPPVTARPGDAPEATGHRGDGTGPGGGLDRLRAAWRAVVDRYGYRKLVVTVLAFFAAVLAAVTLIELAAGKPLSDVVRNEEGAGTSLFGGATAPDAVGTTTDPAAQDGSRGGSGVGAEPRTDENGTDELTDPAVPAPGDQQTAEPGGSVPEPTPSDATPEAGEEEATPTPSDPSSPQEQPTPADAPGNQAPTGDQPVQPAPDVQEQSVPEPAPAQ